MSLAKKIENRSLSQRDSQKFILALKHDVALTPFIQQAQDFIAHLPATLGLAEQFLDIQANFQILKARPLSAVQLNRLVQSYAEENQQDIQHYFEQFKAILSNDVQVSATSRHILDPRCKSEQDFSSSINHYKKGLVQILFLLLAFNRHDFTYTDELITDFLSFLNHIYTATTISRIKLRENANINSDVLMEIPRNTAVHVYGHPVNGHWVKVTVQTEDKMTEGYLQHNYLKPLI